MSILVYRLSSLKSWFTLFLPFLFPIDEILKISGTITDLVFTMAPRFIPFHALLTLIYPLALCYLIVWQILTFDTFSAMWWTRLAYVFFPEKTAAVQGWHIPTIVGEVRAFLGCSGWIILIVCSVYRYQSSRFRCCPVPSTRQTRICDRLCQSMSPSCRAKWCKLHYPFRHLGHWRVVRGTARGWRTSANDAAIVRSANLPTALERRTLPSIVQQLLRHVSRLTIIDVVLYKKMIDPNTHEGQLQIFCPAVNKRCGGAIMKHRPVRVLNVLWPE